MKDTDILEIILNNLKICDKHIVIRNKDNNIVFPKDLDSIKEIERLISSIKNGKEFKDNKGNNYVIKSNSFHYNGENYIFNIIENNNKLKKIEEKSKYDVATKLLNKENILSTIEKYILNKNNDLKEIAVVVCDIDKFKSINDQYNHSAGDKVLETVANLFNEFQSRYNNFVTGRFGGDEFVLVFKNTNSKEVLNIINKIKNKIENETIEYNDKSIKITMSFGIYAIDGFISKEFTSLTDIVDKRKELFNYADKALYDSKKNGRNKITIIVEQEKKFRVI